MTNFQGHEMARSVTTGDVTQMGPVRCVGRETTKGVME